MCYPGVSPGTADSAGWSVDQAIAAPTDKCGRVIVDEFPAVDDRTLVLLQAGNVNTGHSDPFRRLIPIVHRQGGSVPVDGAFGLWAKHIAGLLDAAGAQVLVPVALNQVLVRSDDDHTDGHTTDAVIAAVHAARTCCAGGTSWHGNRAMRISICDAATTTPDVETAAQAIVRCWRTHKDR